MGSRVLYQNDMFLNSEFYETMGSMWLFSKTVYWKWIQLNYIILFLYIAHVGMCHDNLGISLHTKKVNTERVWYTELKHTY